MRDHQVLTVLARRIVRRVKPWVVWLLLLTTPKRPYVVVHGYPDSEGNSVEMVRALVDRYGGGVYLLADSPVTARKVLRDARIDQSERVAILQYKSLRALFRFVTAEVSLFTHGVYGCPRRVPRKTLVNLWHGGGIKVGIMADERGRPYVHADYLVAATRWKGAIMARQCRLPDGGLLLTGNPRVDQFGEVDPGALKSVGIDPARPFVVWMPTFRRSTRQLATSTGAEDPGADLVNASAQVVVDGLANAGIQVVVKPHPSDADRHEIAGAITVTNDALVQNGVFLYQLLGCANGLLTDYSSVWIDYLTLDRPIGFLVPDEATYADSRGFDPPDALEWLPGPRVRTAADIAAFAEDVLSKGALTEARRREVSEHIGLVRESGVAERILDELAAKGGSGPASVR